MLKLTGLIDCNNFFVSCERLFRPDLRGKPVVVLSSNDGCVVARSQEVKDIGIPMGVPYFQIKDIVKDKGITTFSSNFTLYRDLSRRVFLVLKELVSEVEIYSIDEAFFTIKGDSATSILEQIAKIKAAVESSVGVPVSIGVATTKTQAKLASHTAKRGTGCALVLREEFKERYGMLLIGEVWGVGGRLARRYTEAGYHTINSVIEADGARLASLFGVGGTRLQAELRGDTKSAVSFVSPQLPQSIMSTRSFGKKTNDLAIIKDALSYHVREVSADLRSQGLVASQLSVMLLTSRHSDYVLRGGTETWLLPESTASADTLLKHALAELNTLYEPEIPYSKTGVVVSALTPASMASLSLFTTQESQHTTVSDVIDEITNKHGRQAIELGRFHKSSAWRSRQETLSPAYTTRWSDIRFVKAL